MKALKEYIGGHPSFNRGQLTMHETGMLIVAAGRKAGFDVRSEVQVEIPGWQTKKKIDFGWYHADDPKTLVVAWEVDGLDVPENHICGNEKRAGNRAKFNAINARRKVQVLYSLRNRRQLSPCNHALVQKQLGSGISVVTDEELYAFDKIDQWLAFLEI